MNNVKTYILFIIFNISYKTELREYIQINFKRKDKWIKISNDPFFCSIGENSNWSRHDCPALWGLEHHVDPCIMVGPRFNIKFIPSLVSPGVTIGQFEVNRKVLVVPLVVSVVKF